MEIELPTCWEGRPANLYDVPLATTLHRAVAHHLDRLESGSRREEEGLCGLGSWLYLEYLANRGLGGADYHCHCCIGQRTCLIFRGHEVAVDGCDGFRSKHWDTMTRNVGNMSYQLVLEALLDGEGIARWQKGRKKHEKADHQCRMKHTV